MENNLDYVIGFDALYESAMRCKKNVLWKDSVAHYILNIAEETTKLAEQLESGVYQPRPQRPFKVNNCGKERVVMGISFRDRVYQRSLNDNAIYPQMSKSFIYDNAACQNGKGTDFARRRLVCFLQRFYRKHGQNGYILQCDIKGYYPNMRHEVAEATFKKHLSSKVFELALKVMRDQYAGEIGYLPGSQMIQIAGISVLDDLDHFIKERLRIKYYVRYMDDFILIHEDEKYLEECRSQIAKKLADIGFELHPKKTELFNIANSFKFLGFFFRLTETGKVVKLIDPKKVKTYRRKLRRLVGLAYKGRMSRQEVDQCYRSWRAHAERGDSRNLLHRMDTYYKSLWGSIKPPETYCPVERD